MATVTLKIILVAGIGFAMAFAVSCDGGGGNEEGGVSSSSAPPSSSSVALSSSSVVLSSSSVLPSSSSVAPSSSSSIQCSNAGNGTFTDERDDKTYRYVTMCSQTWMAENLNYEASGSKCHSNNESNCATYGRLYDWATAMELPSTCNSSNCASQIQTKHRGICPSGWHIPSNAEWDKLFHYVDGTSGTGNYDSPTAGRYLKSTSGWNSGGNGEGEYGFSALPGGSFLGGSFSSVGYSGYWWSANENGSRNAYSRYMYYDGEYAHCVNYDKNSLFSVRCVKD